MKAYDIEKKEYTEMTDEVISERLIEERQLIENQDAEIKELKRRIEEINEKKAAMVGIVDACIQAMFTARNAIKKIYDMKQGE